VTEAFQGVGWSFPVRVATGRPETADMPPALGPPADDPEERRIELAREERSIRESILLIVGTARGERVMRPDFGCGLHDLVFEPNDSMTAARASSEVRESLIDWEPRIDVLEVQVVADGVERNKLLISVDYRIRRTNSVFNLVYPFYLESAGAQSR
jgi:Bacteriophage baseplate protein W